MKALAVLKYLVPLGVGLAALAWAARLIDSSKVARLVAAVGLAFFLVLVVRDGLNPHEGRFDAWRLLAALTFLWVVGARKSDSAPFVDFAQGVA